MFFAVKCLPYDANTPLIYYLFNVLSDFSGKAILPVLLLQMVFDTVFATQILFVRFTHIYNVGFGLLILFSILFGMLLLNFLKKSYDNLLGNRFFFQINTMRS